jgi:hypothetical protein
MFVPNVPAIINCRRTQRKRDRYGQSRRFLAANHDAATAHGGHAATGGDRWCRVLDYPASGHVGPAPWTQMNAPAHKITWFVTAYVQM